MTIGGDRDKLLDDPDEVMISFAVRVARAVAKTYELEPACLDQIQAVLELSSRQALFAHLIRPGQKMHYLELYSNFAKSLGQASPSAVSCIASFVSFISVSSDDECRSMMQVVSQVADKPMRFRASTPRDAIFEGIHSRTESLRESEAFSRSVECASTMASIWQPVWEATK